MKNYQLYNAAIFNLTADDMPPSHHIDALAQLHSHFRVAYQHYITHVSPVDRYDYTATDAFLTRLHLLSQEMAAPPSGTALVLHGPAHQINLMPLTTFLDEYHPTLCIAIIDSISAALIDYLHPMHLPDYKQATATLTGWKFIFTEIA